MKRNRNLVFLALIIILCLSVMTGFSKSEEKNPWKIIDQLSEKITSLENEVATKSDKIAEAERTIAEQQAIIDKQKATIEEQKNTINEKTTIINNSILVPKLTQGMKLDELTKAIGRPYDTYSEYGPNFSVFYYWQETKTIEGIPYRITYGGDTIVHQSEIDKDPSRRLYNISYTLTPLNEFNN